MKKTMMLAALPLVLLAGHVHAGEKEKTFDQSWLASKLTKIVTTLGPAKVDDEAAAKRVAWAEPQGGNRGTGGSGGCTSAAEPIVDNGPLNFAR